MRSAFRKRALGAATLALALVAWACAPGAGPSPTDTAPKEGPTITVASFAFGESEILAEIYAQVLEAHGYPVQRNLNLGSREIVKPALEAGEIHLVPEYCGTLLTFLDGRPSPDTRATCGEARERFEEAGVTLLDPAPAEDKNGFVVTRATSEEYGLIKVSDLRPVASELVLGGPPECPQREHCLLGLQVVYGIESFREFRPLEIGPIMVEALRAGEIDVALLFTTDAFIVAHDLVLLEDDQRLQPAENVVPAVRSDIVEAYGDEFTSLLNRVSAEITTEGLTVLNARFQIDQEDAATIARDWLVEHGFVES